jgi:hypothetical protein
VFIPIVRLFEIHDQAWFPQFLRDEFVDGLQMILDVSNTYQPIAKLLGKRVKESGAERVLDLCSGAGGPWPSLVRHFEISGARAPEVLLTDKYPSTRELHDFESPATSRIHFLRHSVDATQIPEHLHGFRTLFSSFHHLNPDEARGLLQDSVSRRQGIGIFEAPARRTLTLLSLLFIPVAAWLFVPFRRPFRWSRLLWTYLIPVIPFVLFFDGLISCLRAYSPAELQEMTRGLATSGYRWEIGREVGRAAASPGYVLSWLPAECIRRIRRLNPPTQPARAADWLTHRKRTLFSGEAGSEENG